MRDTEAYVDMLRSNLAMSEAVLHAIDPHLPADLTRGLRDDCARLRSDLTAFGVPTTVAAPEFAVSGRSAALGALYVCEGARLGGRVLARRARTDLGLKPDVMAYLSGSGAETGARWRCFVERLNGELTSPGDRESARDAACIVFDLIIALYQEASCRTT